MTRCHSVAERSPWGRGALIGAVVAVIVTALLAGLGGPRRAAAGAGSVAGSAGTDAALPDDPASAMTKSGAAGGPWGGLSVHVNQTQSLVNQAVTVQWTESPAKPTFSDPKTGVFTGPYNGNFVQIFQCWSAPSTEPTPEQCMFGGESSKGPASYPIDLSSGTHAFERVLADQQASCGSTAPADCLSFDAATALAKSDPSKAALALGGAWVVDPFLAVDGTVVPVSADLACCSGQPPWPPFDLNPYYNYATTNEIDFARTYPDGTGQELFQVDTGLEAPGLGCGQALYQGSTVPQCWLVVVPRGTPAEENPTTASGGVNGEVDTSPLVPSAWKNRIEFPLTFQPIASGCSLSANVRRILGDELAGPAVTSWQPAVCGQPNAPAFTYTKLSDDNVRTQFGTSPGLSVVARPLDPSMVDPTNPPTYAPLTLSGVVVGFTIRRVPGLRGGKPSPDEVPLAGRPVTKLYLTPRLMAKLLTQSYRSQLFQIPATPPVGYEWVERPDGTANPFTIVSDPDFLQFNPEFQNLDTAYGVEAGGLTVEQQSSDAALELWQWVLADPEAKAWLDGTPDKWGMRVNPYYSTSAQLNPSGLAFGGDPNTGGPLADFPKSDPYCKAPGLTLSFNAPSICAADWLPYQNTMRDAATVTQSARTGAKTYLNPFPTLSGNVWLPTDRQNINQRFILSITDSADAARYGIQQAMLSQAGDDSDTRAFIAPDAPGLTAGQKAMKDSGVPGVLVPDPTTRASGAYPLAMLTYAVATPLSLDSVARSDYASFLTYATGAGQSAGTSVGNLPPGYVPLPANLVSEDQQAIANIVNPSSPVTTTTTTTAVAAPTTTVAPTTKILPTTVAPPSAATLATTAPSIAAAVPPVAVSASPSTGAPSPQIVASAPPTTTAPPVHRLTTAAASVGTVRFAVPLGLLAGALSMAGTVLFGRPRRRMVSASTPTEGESTRARRPDPGPS